VKRGGGLLEDILWGRGRGVGLKGGGQFNIEEKTPYGLFCVVELKFEESPSLGSAGEKVDLEKMESRGERMWGDLRKGKKNFEHLGKK